MKKSLLGLFAIIASSWVGCGQPEAVKKTESTPGIAVTIWTSKSELFMEYATPVTGKETRFAVHLTWLPGFKAVTEGRLSLEFLSNGGVRRSVVSDGPTSPGIFRPAITFDQPGTYRLTLVIEGSSRDTLFVDDFIVYASADKIPTEEEKPSRAQLISFLKEQQWKIDFRTEAVFRKPMSGTVRASGEIISKINNEVYVAAPFTGVIRLEENTNLPVIGQPVRRGERLAVIAPSDETPGGVENFSTRLLKAETDYALAEKESKRARGLHAIDGIPEKDYLEAEAAFKRAEATMKGFGKYVNTSENSRSLNVFPVESPLEGTIIESHVIPGKQVNAGEMLYRIIDTRTVWVKANVPSTEIGRLSRPTRASLELNGLDKTITIDEQKGKLVSVAAAIDPATRAFPVVFEIKNPDGLLRIGMFGEVVILTGQERETLVIKESALLEEEGRFSVFVHVEGEAFERREVTLGEKNGEFAEIKNGLSAGERVVTVGAYQVRLASLSTQLPTHGHEH